MINNNQKRKGLTNPIFNIVNFYHVTFSTHSFFLTHQIFRESQSIFFLIYYNLYYYNVTMTKFLITNSHCNVLHFTNGT